MPINNTVSNRKLLLKMRPVLKWLFKLRGSPQAIAGGFGLGMFISFTPTIGLQILIALPLATLLNLNRPATVVPIMLTNVLTVLGVFTFNYWVGSFLWPGPDVGEVYRRLLMTTSNLFTLDCWQILEQMKLFTELGREIFIPLVVGSVLVGIVAGFLSYFLMLRILAWITLRREKKERQVLMV